MKKYFVVVTCDACGTEKQYPSWYVNEQMKQDGWISCQNNIHYCSSQCKVNHQQVKK